MKSELQLETVATTALERDATPPRRRRRGRQRVQVSREPRQFRDGVRALDVMLRETSASLQKIASMACGGV